MPQGILLPTRTISQHFPCGLEAFHLCAYGTVFSPTPSHVCLVMHGTHPIPFRPNMSLPTPSSPVLSHLVLFGPSRLVLSHPIPSCLPYSSGPIPVLSCVLSCVGCPSNPILLCPPPFPSRPVLSRLSGFISCVGFPSTYPVLSHPVLSCLDYQASLAASAGLRSSLWTS